METEEMIVTIIGAVLGSGILNCIITHILYSNRLKKELKQTRISRNEKMEENEEEGISSAV